jgi:(2Fe-2S) ferredoxin
MRKPRVLFALLTTCCGLCALAPSMAYEDDGHFYTIIASERLSNKLNAPHDEAALYSFCAQLPDLAKELDATTLRYGVLLNPSWAWRDECDDETLHMVTTQRIVHALTGSDAERVTRAAVAIVMRLRYENEKPDFNQNRACAVGLPQIPISSTCPRHWSRLEP